MFRSSSTAVVLNYKHRISLKMILEIKENKAFKMRSNLNICSSNINPHNTDGECFAAELLLLLLIIHTKQMCVCMFMR